MNDLQCFYLYKKNLPKTPFTLIGSYKSLKTQIASHSAGATLKAFPARLLQDMLKIAVSANRVCDF